METSHDKNIELASSRDERLKFWLITPKVCEEQIISRVEWKLLRTLFVFYFYLKILATESQSIRRSNISLPEIMTHKLKSHISDWKPRCRLIYKTLVMLFWWNIICIIQPCANRSDNTLIHTHTLQLEFELTCWRCLQMVPRQRRVERFFLLDFH